MTNKEKIAFLAETYAETVIQFYRDKRNAGITPTNSEILAACPIPTGLGDVEHEAFVIIVTVTQLVDADMSNAPKADNGVKSCPEFERRRKRMQELETEAVNARRHERVKQLRAENAAAEARRTLLDTKFAEHRAQSQVRLAVKAERAKIDAQLAAMEKLRTQSYPIPRG